MFDEFIAGIVGVLNVPVSAIANFFDDPLSTVADIPNAIIRAAAWFYQSLLSFGSIIANAVLEAMQLIETIMGTVILAAKELTSTVIDGLYGVFNWLTDWTNSIYSGFASQIDDTVAEIENHVIQFSNGVVNKAESLLVLNSAMAILKKNIESTTQPFQIGRTVKEMGSAALVSYFAGALFKGLI